MKIRKKMFYNIKRLIPMAGIATLTMLPTSCGPDSEPMKIEQNDSDKKRGNNPTDSVAPADTTVIPTDTIAPVDTIVQPVDTRRDVEIFFHSSSSSDALNSAILDTCINDTTIRTIYLHPLGTWDDLAISNIKFMHIKFLKPIMDKSPKLRGRGNFNFLPGEASKSQTDSLWYIENGWTINQPTQPDPTKHDDILFVFRNASNNLDRNLLTTFIDDTITKKIYLVPMGHWKQYDLDSISYLYHEVLEAKMEMSPKIRGRGDFDFKPGEASKSITDSLWFVGNGWTINKDLQR